MPRRDGTGPMGQGQKTGRGEGPCNGTERSFLRDRRGNGQRGFGQGRGQGVSLREKVEQLENEIKEIKKSEDN